MTLFVLIIEDLPLHAKLFSEMLRAGGHFSVTALTGREGLALIGTAKPDLIVVDVILPDIDGRELIAELRRMPRSADTPILAVSAAADRDMERSCVSSGADCFLRKPMRVRDFSHAVASLCR